MVNKNTSTPRLTHSHSWEGIATATSSVHHGGERLGYTTYLRREKVYNPTISTQTGNYETFWEVPIISGNSVRGILRTLAANMWWEVIGQPPLPLSVSHAIWAGGALTQSSTPLTGRDLVEVFEVCPVVEIFGTSGGGRMIDGKLSVSKMVPLCTETSHLLNESYRNLCTRSFWDFLQIEKYSRHGTHDTLIDEKIPSTETNFSEKTKKVNIGERRMRWEVESYIPGTKFRLKIGTENLSSLSYSFFLDTLNEFFVKGWIGGKKGSGFGEFVFSPNQPVRGMVFEELQNGDEKPQLPNWKAMLSSYPTSFVQERIARLG